MADIRSPRIRFPKDGAAVDGTATTLTWEPVPGASYRVQVSASDRFDALIVDADAGKSTSLTLYQLLPRDGRRLHWRVANANAEAEPLWSNPAWFLAADVEDRPTPAAPAAAPVRTVPQPAERRPVPDDAPLYMTETTGTRELLMACAVLLITVILLLVVAF